jgi:Fe(3+) dicitrate transport protein
MRRGAVVGSLALAVQSVVTAVAFGGDPQNQPAPAPHAPDATQAPAPAKKPDGTETPPEAQSDLKSAIDGANAANPYPMTGEIVVSADRGMVPLMFPHGRDVVDHQTLQTYPQGSITETLRQQPGIFIQSDAGNDIKMSIGIRGQQARVSAFTGILVDGIPVKQTLYGVVDLDIFPFTFERAYRIDVIRGGADLRYGPNAYGGVINFITAPIPEQETVRFRGAYGSDDEYSAMTEAGGTWGQFGVLVTGVYKGGDGWRDNSDYTQEDGSVKFRWRFDDKSELTGSVNRYYERVEFASGLTQAQFEDDPEQSRAEHDYGRGDVNRYNATFTHRFSEDTAFDAIVWYHESYREFSLAQPVLPPFARQNHQPANYKHRGVEARMSWNTEILGMKHSFFHSARYYDDDTNRYSYTRPYDSFPFGPKTVVSDADFTTLSFALFCEDTISLLDNLDLALGFRAENTEMDMDNRVTGAQANANYSDTLPTGSLTWRPIPRTAMFASYSEGYGTPLYNTMDPSNPSYNPDLKPEEAKNYEGGVRSREFAGFEASAVLFRQEYDDKIERSTRSDGTTRYFNTGEAHTEGIELAASYDFGGVVPELKGLTLWANYTDMTAEFDHGSSAPGLGDDLAGKRLPNAPEVLANVGVTYRHTSGIWARIARNHTGDYYSDALNSDVPSPDGVAGYVPEFTIWDAAIGWNQNPDGTGLAVAVGCTNLFDDDDWFRRNTTGIQPGAPRRFNVNVSYTLTF